MKKIVFSGYLTNDKDCFVEIALCCYNFKKDGKKEFHPYVSVLEVEDSSRELHVVENVQDMVSFVHGIGMCKTDVDKLIKGFNKYPFDTITVFSTEAESHLCEKLREAAFPDED